MGIVTDIAGVSDSSPGGLQSGEDQATEGHLRLRRGREPDETPSSGADSIFRYAKAGSGSSATKDEDGRGLGP